MSSLSALSSSAPAAAFASFRSAYTLNNPGTKGVRMVHLCCKCSHHEARLRVALVLHDDATEQQAVLTAVGSLFVNGVYKTLGPCSGAAGLLTILSVPVGASLDDGIGDWLEAYFRSSEGMARTALECAKNAIRACCQGEVILRVRVYERTLLRRETAAAAAPTAIAPACQIAAAAATAARAPAPTGAIAPTCQIAAAVAARAPAQTDEIDMTGEGDEPAPAAPCECAPRDRCIVRA